MLAPARPAARGYTLVELVLVMIILGILSAVAVPKLQGLISFRDDAWRDQLVSGLRFAQKVAVGHRRLVCASVGTTTLTLTIASTNPASACSGSLAGPGGSTDFATSADNGSATSVSPAGLLYFQPDGRVTSDGAGTSAANRTISMTGASDVTVVGETGYVQ